MSGEAVFGQYLPQLVAGAGLILTTPAPGVVQLDATGGGGGAVVLTGVGTPAALAAGGTNNFAPILTGFSRLNLTGGAGGSTVTGLAGGTDGRVLIITNIGADDITLTDEDALSIAANRFASNGDTILQQNESAEFIYVGAISRWSRIGF